MALLEDDRSRQDAGRLPLFGAAALLVSFGASTLLALAHFKALSLPGCGVGDACDRVAQSVWGKLPGLGWPVSFVGCAYFGAALVFWLGSRRGIPRALLSVIRVGALVSLFYVGVMTVGGHICLYCLGTHVGNFVFWILAERSRMLAPVPLLAAVRNAALTFAVISLALGLGDWQHRKRVERRDREDLNDSLGQVVQAGDTGGFRGRYLRGPEAAPIRIVTFTDYQCSHCYELERELRPIVQDSSDVSFSVKQYPLSAECNSYYKGARQHQNSCWAARAAEAAGTLWGDESFFAFHEWIFDRRGGFTKQQLETFVAGQGHDPAPFFEAMHSAETTQRIQADIKEAKSLGLLSTPMIFINGVELRGLRPGGGLYQAVHKLREAGPAEVRTDVPAGALEKYVGEWRKSPVRIMPQGISDWTIGPQDAALRMMMWIDLRSPAGALTYQKIRELIAEREDVRYQVHPFPLEKACNPMTQVERYGQNCMAAQAAEAAGQLAGIEGYWLALDLIIDGQERFGPELLEELAEALDLELSEYLERMDSGSVRDAVRAKAREGGRLGLNSIPTLFINEKLVPRPIFEEEPIMATILDEALGR